MPSRARSEMWRFNFKTIPVLLKSCQVAAWTAFSHHTVAYKLAHNSHLEHAKRKVEISGPVSIIAELLAYRIVYVKIFIWSQKCKTILNLIRHLMQLIGHHIWTASMQFWICKYQQVSTAAVIMWVLGPPSTSLQTTAYLAIATTTLGAA